MGLSVSEIRHRAERLKAQINRERYETKAGLKERPNLTELYAAHDLLLDDDTIPAIQRELAKATGDEQRRLRYLLAWVTGQQVKAAVAPLEDEYRAWESTVTVRLGSDELPIRQLPRVMASEPNRDTRIAIEQAFNARLEEARALQIEQFYREQEAVVGLGFGDYLEARERLSGLNVHGLKRQAEKILAATEEAYAEHLARQLWRQLFGHGSAHI